jgi:hypothetical protein
MSTQQSSIMSQIGLCLQDGQPWSAACNNDLMLYTSAASQKVMIGVNNGEVNPALSIARDITVGGHIIPAINEAYDMGTPDMRFRDLYLSGNTLHIGGARISKTSDSTVQVTNASTNTVMRLIVDEIQVGSQGNSTLLKSDPDTGYLQVSQNVPEGSETSDAPPIAQPITAASIILQKGGSNSVISTANGNVGINTPVDEAPQYALDVNGVFRCSSYAGLINSFAATSTDLPTSAYALFNGVQYCQNNLQSLSNGVLTTINATKASMVQLSNDVYGALGTVATNTTDGVGALSNNIYTYTRALSNNIYTNITSLSNATHNRIVTFSNHVYPTISTLSNATNVRVIQLTNDVVGLSNAANTRIIGLSNNIYTYSIALSNHVIALSNNVYTMVADGLSAYSNDTYGQLANLTDNVVGGLSNDINMQLVTLADNFTEVVGGLSNDTNNKITSLTANIVSAVGGLSNNIYTEMAAGFVSTQNNLNTLSNHVYTSVFDKLNALSNDIPQTIANLSNDVYMGIASAQVWSSNAQGGITATYNTEIQGDLNLVGAFLQNGAPAVFSQWYTDSEGSTVYLNGSNVAIGKSTAAVQALDVVGNVNVSGQYLVNGQAVRSSPWSSNGNHISYSNSGAAGFVGIGTRSPAFPLDVVGNLNITGNYMRNGAQLVTSQWTTVNTSNIYYNNNNGLVGIGTTTPSYTLHVVGDIYATKDVFGFSDRRVKTDLQPITEALERVKNLTGYTYLRSDIENGGVRNVGLVAQDVEKVLPEAVSTDAQSGFKSIAYGNMAGLFVQAIKELEDRIKGIEARLC